MHEYQLNRNAISLRNKAYEAYDDDRVDAAIRHLQRYLGFVPHDAEALAKLGMWSYETAKSPQSRQKAFLKLDQALRENDRRDDLRRLAIRLAVKLGRYRDALVHLNWFCPSPDNSCGGDAELASLKAHSHAGLGEFDLAAEWYSRAIQLDGEYAGTLLDLAKLIDARGDKMDLRPVLRKFGARDGADIGNPAERLDPKEVIETILAAMVQSSHGEARTHAFLARASYRQAHGRLDAAADDVAEAISLSPESGPVLMQAAEIELARAADERFKGSTVRFLTHRDAATGFARRGREAAPDDLRFDLVLSRLEIESGRNVEAAQLLRRGALAIDQWMAKVPRNKVDKELVQQQYDLAIQFTWLLGNILISQAFADQTAPDATALEEVSGQHHSAEETRRPPRVCRFSEGSNSIWPAFLEVCRRKTGIVAGGTVGFSSGEAHRRPVVGRMLRSNLKP